MVYDMEECLAMIQRVSFHSRHKHAYGVVAFVA